MTNEFDMYLSGMSITEIHEETGTPLSTLRFRFKKAEILRTREQGKRIAIDKGRYTHPFKGKTRVFTDEWKQNISKAKKGKGVGFSVKPSGYAEHTMGQHKGKRLHRVLMEEHIGRDLQADEVVHHIDGNKLNNDISNLMVMNNKEHSRLHAKQNASILKRNKYGRFTK